MAARERGADVVVLERASHQLWGGNTSFAAGVMRVAYNGVEDLRRLMPDLTEGEVAVTDFGSYPTGAFLDDLSGPRPGNRARSARHTPRV